MTDQIRVLIVDPRSACRHALAGLIEGTRNGLAVVGEAASVDEALRAAAITEPHVVFLGLRGRWEHDAIARMAGASPPSNVLVLSPEEDGRSVLEALEAGARGYLSERAEPSEILDALYRVAAGRFAVHPTASAAGLLWAVREGTRDDAERLACLTAREREVMSLLADGLSPRAIAERLFLSRRTVEFHLGRVYRKLGVRSRIPAILAFRRLQEAPGGSEVSRASDTATGDIGVPGEGPGRLLRGPPRAARERARMAGEAILVVDDTPDNLDLVRMVLAGEGYDVRTATDAEEALALVEEVRPALILMDLQLPGVDGLDLTRKLKADPRTKDVIIVAQTAYDMKGDRDRALAAGCDGYISKPFSIYALIEVVARCLAKGPG